MRLEITQFAADHYFHFFNHAVYEVNLFNESADYEKCISLFLKYIKPYEFSIISYCLMPNHYHLLLLQKTDISFSQISNKIWYVYTCYYNKKYNRKGTLFSNKLQHIWVSNENYLLKLCAYIHLNPVNANLATNPSKWKWSNYNDLIDYRNNCFIDHHFMSNYFPNPHEYENFISESMKFDDIAKYLLE
jgi:putative transposase